MFCSVIAFLFVGVTDMRSDRDRSASDVIPTSFQRVAPGSTENRIQVSIEHSGGILAESIMVLLVKPLRMYLPGGTTLGPHDTLHVKYDYKVIPTPRSNEEAEVAFTFDVPKDVPPRGKDTLTIIALTQSRQTWSKKIILTYDIPSDFELDQNFPNPFNPTTTIYYQLPREAQVRMTVYDILGREVRLLVDESKEAGYHTVEFNASGLASGVYFYRIEAQSVEGGLLFQKHRKLVFVK